METTGIPELRDIGVSGSVGGVSGVDSRPSSGARYQYNQRPRKERRPSA